MIHFTLDEKDFNTLRELLCRELNVATESLNNAYYMQNSDLRFAIIDKRKQELYEINRIMVNLFSKGNIKKIMKHTQEEIDEAFREGLKYGRTNKIVNNPYDEKEQYELWDSYCEGIKAGNSEKSN